MGSGKMNWRRAQQHARAAAARRAPDQPRVLTTNRCWCGEAKNHEWPGREEGAPHPR